MGPPTSSLAQKDDSPSIQNKFRQGVALHQQGRFAEAELIYRDLLQQDPKSFEAIHLLGVLALQTRKPQQAVELIGKAIALNPAVPTAHCNLGSALTALQRHAEALASFDKAIALKADLADAHANRAAALNALNQYELALSSCDKALALKPDYAEAHNNRAHALNALKRHEEAVAGCDQAIALRPNYPEAHNNRGNALNALARHTDAVASYDKAIGFAPKYAEAYNNRGNALYHLGRAEEAAASYELAIAIRPDYAEAYNNRGNALSSLQRCEPALASYDRAIALNPDYAEALFNKSVLLLLTGRFAEGWRLYEWRKKKANPIAVRDTPQPLWLGDADIAGKTILLTEEQGLGDTIQFCRYAPLVAQRGARVILEVPPQLTRLAASLSGVKQIVETGGPLPAFDLHCPLLSLPLAFKTELATIPAAIPYLKADPHQSKSWKDRLGAKTKLRVGLVWSGGIRPNQPVSVNQRRNVPLAKFAVLKNPDVAFYSLQKGQPGEAELADLTHNRWNGPDIVDLTGAIGDFSDTAAFIDNLDLVITVDTAAAHLAGALGKPVWILNRFDTDWRWLFDRTDSPWYPTAKIYRQDTTGNWDSVLQRVKTDLNGFQPEAY
jgi:tetratricopeptide (TPR) repeat protein